MRTGVRRLSSIYCLFFCLSSLHYRLPLLLSMADKPSSTAITLCDSRKIADFSWGTVTETTKTLLSPSTSTKRRDHVATDGSLPTAGKSESLGERMKRHREEVGGRVLIPEKWGKEEFMKEWIDYSSFDSLLAPTGVSSARQALAEEGRRRSRSPRVRIESRG